jgi:hypothetical protein
MKFQKENMGRAQNNVIAEYKDTIMESPRRKHRARSH